MAERQGGTGPVANAVRLNAPQPEKAKSGRCKTDGGVLERYVAAQRLVALLLSLAMGALLLAGCAGTYPSVSERSPDQCAPELSILLDLRDWDRATPEARRDAARCVARRMPDFELKAISAFACGDQAHEVAVFRHLRTGMDFCLIPVGEFSMGSAESTESPLRRVRLTRPFLVSRWEVTQANWSGVMDRRTDESVESRMPKRDANIWKIDEFCRRAGFRRPFEAEWEWAARGGVEGAWCFGDDETELDWYAWFNTAGRPKTVQPVGAKLHNAFGLFDVHGNVGEVCADHFESWSPEDVVDPMPLGPPGCVDFVAKGGGAWAFAWQTRIDYRDMVRAWQLGSGLRPVVSVDLSARLRVNP